eukprot:scaffold412_cov388-Prasinococcus_capsulatus_cf.AAC.46
MIHTTRTTTTNIRTCATHAELSGPSLAAARRRRFGRLLCRVGLSSSGVMRSQASACGAFGGRPARGGYTVRAAVPASTSAALVRGLACWQRRRGAQGAPRRTLRSASGRASEGESEGGRDRT